VLRALAAAAALAVAAGAHAEAATELRAWTGGETPALAQPTLGGGRSDLRDLKGRVVLVNFWATWCDPCRAEMPSFERLRAKLHGRPFEVLTVNFGENPERIREFLERQRIDLPVLLDRDKEAAAAWHAGGLPMTFLVDARGRVRYSAFGESDWSAGKPLRIVEALVDEAAHAR
jgi:thiol-disulfide isomerase/thioredoxin